MNGFLAKIYSFKFFDNLIFIYPLYTVMFVDTGLSGLQISILLSVWSFTAFMFEVPSGVLADTYSRKYILILAQMAKIAGFACWLIFPNFYGFLCGFILWGIKSAFDSGTFEALVFDALKQAGRDAEYTKIIGRVRSLTFAAKILAALGAAAAIHFGYSFVLIISIVAVIVSSVPLVLLPAAPRFESTHEKEYFTRLKRGLSDAAKTPLIFHLIVFIALLHAFGGAMNDYWPIFAGEIGLEKSSIAIFIAAVSALQAMASVIAHKFSGFSNRFFYGIFALNGVLLLAAVLVFKPAAVFLLLAFVFFFKITDVVFDGKIQHVLPSAQRATIYSVKGLFAEIGITVMYFSVGAVAGAYSYRAGFAICAGLIISVGVAYFLLSLRNGHVAGWRASKDGNLPAMDLD